MRSLLILILSAVACFGQPYYGPITKFALTSSGPVDDTLPPTNIFLVNYADPRMSLQAGVLPKNIWWDTWSNYWYGVYLQNSPSAVYVMRNTNANPLIAGGWVQYSTTQILTNGGANSQPFMYPQHTNGYYYLFAGLDDGNVYCYSNNVLTNQFGNTNISGGRIVLSHGAGGTWDSVRVMETYNWFETNGGPYNGKYCMLFMGAAPAANNEQIGLATCATIDGTYAEVSNNPLIVYGTPTNVAYDAFTVADPWMWYYKGANGTNGWYFGYSANSSNTLPWSTAGAFTPDWTNISKEWVLMAATGTAANPTNRFRGAVYTNGYYYVLPHAGGNYWGSIGAAQYRKIPPGLSAIAVAQTQWTNASMLSCMTLSNCYSSLEVGGVAGVYTNTYADAAVGYPTNSHSFNITNTGLGTNYFYRLNATNTVYATVYTQYTGTFVQGPPSILSPTNGMGGGTVSVWYQPNLTNLSTGGAAQITYTTNSGIPTLANLTGGAGFDQTNKTGSAANYPVGIGTPVDSIAFVNGPWLENNAYTSGTPCTVFCIFAPTNNATSFFWDSENASFRQAYYDPNPFQTFDGAGAAIAAENYAHFDVCKIVYNDGGNCYGITNGVKALVTAGSGNTCSGLRFALHNSGIDPAKMRLVYWCSYTNQLFGNYAGGMFSDNVSSNQYVYMTNLLSLLKLTYP